MDIREAALADCRLIHDMAWETFPNTYKNILTKEQIDYMMEWMYSVDSLKKQMTEEKHTYLSRATHVQAMCRFNRRVTTRITCKKFT